MCLSAGFVGNEGINANACEIARIRRDREIFVGIVLIYYTAVGFIWVFNCIITSSLSS